MRECCSWLSSCSLRKRQGRQQRLKLRADGLVHGRQLQVTSQLFQWLVHHKAWPVGSDLEQDPAGLVEIHRVEVFPIDYRCDRKSLRLDLGTLFQLRFVGRSPERDMMDRSNPSRSSPESRRPPEVNRRGTGVIARLESMEAGIFSGRHEAQCSLQEFRGAQIPVFPDRCAVKLAYGMLRRNWTIGPPRFVQVGHSHELQEQAVGVAECEHLLLEAAYRALVLHLMSQEPLQPKPE